MDFSRGVLHSLEDLITSLLVPQLSNVPEKMSVEKSSCSEFNKQDLLDNIDNFTTILCNSSELLENQVSFCGIKVKYSALSMVLEGLQTFVVSSGKMIGSCICES